MEKVIYTSKDRIPTTASDVGCGILAITAIQRGELGKAVSILVWKEDIDAIYAAIHEGDEPEPVECCENCQVADCGFSNGPHDYCGEHRRKE